MVFDIGIFVDDVYVVGEKSVIGVLGDDIEGDDDGEFLVVIFGVEEVEVGGGFVGVMVGLNGFFNFVVLELDGSVVDIIVIVVFGENLEGFFGFVFVDEEMGRFGDELDIVELKYGGNSLDEGNGVL